MLSIIPLYSLQLHQYNMGHNTPMRKTLHGQQKKGKKYLEKGWIT
jgi:hypothetical protein